MPARAKKSISENGGWRIGRCFLPRNLILTGALAAGRAMRISQDGAFAVVKGMGQAATWSKGCVACSAKVLNPLAWVKRPANKSRPQNRTSPAASNAVVSSPPPSGNAQHENLAAPWALSTAPEKAMPPAPTKVADSEPRPRPPRVSPQLRPRSAPGGAVPPEVTPVEVSAAVFGGISEKVTFVRSLNDLAGLNQITRTHAAAVLGTIRHDLSVKALAARLARDPSAEVRKDCVNALTVLGMSAGLPAVERALSDSSSAVRVAAVRGVYRLAGPSGGSSLVRMLSDKDEGVRRRAAVCIGWLGRADLTAELLPLLQSKSVWVRRAALEAFENLKSPVVVDRVIELLDDPDESVQRKAFDVLRTITGKQMVESFPEDEKERRFLIARWQAWRQDHRGRSQSRSA